MLWTTDEEIGSESSRSLIETTRSRVRAVLVLEPSLPGGAAKTRARASASSRSRSTASPRTRVWIPTRARARSTSSRIRSSPSRRCEAWSRGVTVNVGTIAGGSRTNVVADRARAGVDVRVPDAGGRGGARGADGSAAAALAGTSVEVTGGVTRPPLERTAAVAELYDQARAVAAELGKELGEGAAGGGSDGNFTAALGVPTFDGLGPRGDGAHATHEHVVIADLPWRAAFLAALLSRLRER